MPRSPELGEARSFGSLHAVPSVATLSLSLMLVAMTLRLSDERDRALERIAETLKVSKNTAAAEAIFLAVPHPSHPEFVADSMPRQLSRYADLMSRLANA